MGTDDTKPAVQAKPTKLLDLSSNVTLRKLEWVGVVAPLVFLAVYHYLLRGPAHELLHSVWGMVLLIGLLGITISVFSRLMFHLIARLQRDVQELSEVVANQNAQLKALSQANLALSQERMLSSVLQQVVDLSRELLRARYAALSVLGEGGEMKTFLTSGIDEETRKLLGTAPKGHGVLGLIPHREEPLRLDDVTKHPAAVGFPPGHPVIKTFLGVPIRYKGQALGSLYLAEKLGGQPFTLEDEEVAQLFANQAAVAIQNAHLNEQVQAMAVETERARISREMHDGLAQVLAYVNTKAQAVEAFLQKGAVAEAEEQVRELSQAARKVYQDVREGILALRSQMGSGRSFREVLEEYVSEYRQQLRRPVEMRWEVSPEELDLSPLQEVQVLRIIQEALTNVRKHAEANSVQVTFGARDGALEIRVTDDGKGFNPLAIKRGEWPHLGLQTMQERAEAIGGTFEIDSSPGKGTTVRVTLPSPAYPGVREGTK